MRLQLTVFSLYVLAFFLLWQLAKLLPPPRRRRPGAPQGRADGGFAATMKSMFKSSLHTYLPLAAVALLMLSYGKPGLWPQWAGWAVVGLQFLRSLAAAGGLSRTKVILGLLAAICLGYLWILQLPFFDPFPA